MTTTTQSKMRSWGGFIRRVSKECRELNSRTASPEDLSWGARSTLNMVRAIEAGYDTCPKIFKAGILHQANGEPYATQGINKRAQTLADAGLIRRVRVGNTYRLLPIQSEPMTVQQFIEIVIRVPV